MKLERLISIIYKLLNNEVVSSAKLAEEFEVSQRTIYRDIDVICAAGFPVVSYQGINGGYGMIDGYKLDKSLLGSYDIASLITVLNSLSTVFEDERAQGTIERLQSLDRESLAPSLAVDFINSRTAAEMLPNLRKAILERISLRFEYINAKNERMIREIEPVQLHYKYGNWYLYGYCSIRQDYREFRLSRMLDLSLTMDTFLPHHAAKEAECPDRSWQAQVEEVVVLVSPGALAEAMDRFQQVDKHFHADGSMELRIPVHKPLQARWLWSILLSFGSGAQVMTPPALRGILREQLLETLKLYEEV